MHSRKVALSLGANVGNRLSSLVAAAALLDNSGLRVTAKSRVWETSPWGLEAQPRFLNMCLTAESGLGCEEMLAAVKNIEMELGRRQRCHWGPREIDIDIIFIGGCVVDTPQLKVPHPLMQQRAFVLVPLNEIAPDFVHPLLGKSVKELLHELPPERMDWIIRL